MKSTVELLDAVRAKHGLTSDYQLSKILGIRPTTVSNYRVRRSFPDETVCLKIAKLLDLEPGYVLAVVAAERAQSVEIRKAWEKAAKAVAGTAVALVAGCALALAPLPYSAPSAAAAPALYIMSSLLLLLAWRAR